MVPSVDHTYLSLKPDYQSLTVQALDLVREQIQGGVWGNALPSERKLAASLQVSRKTVRKILAQLRTEGLVSLQGKRNLITGAEGREPRRPKVRVGLLLSQPLERMRPFALLWINHLMALLQESGHPLEIFHGHKYYGMHPEKTLERLVAENPATFWIIGTSNRVLQNWFQKAGVPVIIAGSAHQGIHLPSVDLDHRAQARHAATHLLRAGHRRLALFLAQGDAAGDAECEEGFREGIAGFPATAFPPLVYRVDSQRQSMVNALHRALTTAPPATALLLSSPLSYLTAVSYLGSVGKRVPADISLLSCKEEPFFSHLHPSPAYYTVSPAKFAAVLHRTLRKEIQGGTETGQAVRIMPELVPGETIRQMKPILVS